VLPAAGDTGYDALPVNTWKPSPNQSEPARIAIRRRRSALTEARGLPGLVLDRLKIETMLANRIAMGGRRAAAILWVPFEDA